jgi:hypothetical protein
MDGGASTKSTPLTVLLIKVLEYCLMFVLLKADMSLLKSTQDFIIEL